MLLGSHFSVVQKATFRWQGENQRGFLFTKTENLVIYVDSTSKLCYSPKAH